MSPDARTLFAIIALLTFAAGFLLLALWSSMRERAGLRTWAASLFVRAPGFVLLAGRGSFPFWLSIDLSNALMCIGSGLGFVAARELSGVRVGRIAAGLIVFAPALLWLVSCQIPLIYDDVILRTIVVAVPLCVYAAATSWAFMGLERTSLTVRLGFFGLWAVAAAAHGMRAVLVVLDPPDLHLTQPSGLFTLTLLIPILTFALGLLWTGVLYREWRLSELRRRAERDWLTSVLNRAGFLRRAADRLFAMSGQNCVLVMDLDHFKQVNDRYGHAVGDQMLIAFCRRVEGLLPAGAVFGRMGGEEFAIACRSSADEALRLAERLRGAVEASPLLADEGGLRVTVSIGVAASTGRERELDRLLAAADQALYRSKRQGRNRVSLAEQSDSQSADGLLRAASPLSGNGVPA